MENLNLYLINTLTKAKQTLENPQLTNMEIQLVYALIINNIEKLEKKEGIVHEEAKIIQMFP